MDRRERVPFLPRKGMSSLGARKSLILARLSDKKKRQDETSTSTVIETDWKVLESLLQTDVIRVMKKYFFIIDKCSLTNAIN